jgi:hypothetical protein
MYATSFGGNSGDPRLAFMARQRRNDTFIPGLIMQQQPQQLQQQPKKRRLAASVSRIVTVCDYHHRSKKRCPPECPYVTLRFCFCVCVFLSIVFDCVSV